MLSLFVGTLSYGQTELVIEPDAGFLNELIIADNQAHDIYVLKRNETYYVQGAFENQGWKLHMKAEDGDGELPIISPFPNDKNKLNAALISLYGDVELENLHMKGDYEDLKSCKNVVSNLYEGAKIDIRGCILSGARNSHVSTTSPADYVKIDNCLFLNMGNLSMGNQGNGRAVDLRDVDVNLVSLTNSTIINSMDRVLRHRGGGTLKEVVIDHCTMINNGGYHGFIELGGIESFKMTNNLMVDCMGFGADQFDDERLVELDAHTEMVEGKAKMVWIGSIPDSANIPVPSTFEISHNIYSVSTELQTYYDLVQGNKVAITEGPILTDYIAGKIDNAETAFLKKSITLTDIPVSMTNVYTYHTDPNGGNYLKQTTDAVDYDRKDYAYWTSTLDCSYATDDTDFMGSDDIPVGDPRWESTVGEGGTGVIANIASAFQVVSYPNPFSEFTTIEFSLEEASNISVDIHDITGKLVRKGNLGNYSTGKNSIVIQKGNLVSGIYFLKINAGMQTGFIKVSVK